MKLLCVQVIKDMLSEGIDVSKMQKFSKKNLAADKTLNAARITLYFYSYNIHYNHLIMLICIHRKIEKVNCFRQHLFI